MRRVDLASTLLAFAIHGCQLSSIEGRVYDKRQDAHALHDATPLHHSIAESSELQRRWHKVRSSSPLTAFASFLLAFNAGSGVPAITAGAGHVNAIRQRCRSAPRALQMPWQKNEADLTKLPDVEAFEAKIEDAADKNKVIVIGFFASWCRICKAFKPKYRTIAGKWNDVEFCEILYDENKVLAKTQGIRSLPFIEIYLGSKGRVEGFQCGPSKIEKLQTALESYATDGPEALDNR
mmetsp:Transcript_115558/g.204254  ORF Transcript_115558/g.204254 Transcript_115558/m.204254 type:complete len:236 (-) Transcript_115558:60-767(-)